MLNLRLADDDDEREGVVAELQAAGGAEYADLLERLPSFFAELETEIARGHASYVELEGSEVDLSRFRAWAAKIEQRDDLGAPLQTVALSVVRPAVLVSHAFLPGEAFDVAR